MLGSKLHCQKVLNRNSFTTSFRMERARLGSKKGGGRGVRPTGGSRAKRHERYPHLRTPTRHTPIGNIHARHTHASVGHTQTTHTRVSDTSTPVYATPSTRRTGGSRANRHERYLQLCTPTRYTPCVHTHARHTHPSVGHTEITPKPHTRKKGAPLPTFLNPPFSTHFSNLKLHFQNP